MRVVMLAARQTKAEDGVTTTFHGGLTFEVDDELARRWLLEGAAKDDAGLVTICGAIDAKDSRKCVLLSDHPLDAHADKDGKPVVPEPSKEERVSVAPPAAVLANGSTMSEATPVTAPADSTKAEE